MPKVSSARRAEKPRTRGMSQPPDARREVGGGFVAPRVALPAVAALTSQLADGHCKVWTDVAVRRRWTSERRAGNPTDNGARQGESLEHVYWLVAG